ncbi:MAG TPA: ABC transporter ATP-binding protein [Phycisphaerae bacterium]|nr:ABC transporter ATP-binding protein [Phycisphaerae bacterium]
MQAWWRVLRGVWPYRTLVVISIICALGVGLSYASGVAVMLPVLKIFISTEGIHGWVDREAAQDRLGVTLWDLDQTVAKGQSGVVIDSANVKRVASPVLNPAGQPYKVVAQVTYDEGEKTQSAEKGQWRGMVNMIARAPAGGHLTMVLKGVGGQEVLKGLELRRASFHERMLLRVVDHLPEDPFSALVYLVVFFIVLCIVGSVFRYYQQYLGMAVATRVIADLRRRMYDRITQLPTSYFAQRGTSDLMSRLTQDTNTLTDGVSMAFGKAIQEPVKAAGAFGVAMWLDWRLTMMIVVSSPILAVIIRKFSKRMRKAGRRALENWSSMLGIINETLIGARVVKAYSAEGYERRRFARVNKALVKEQTRLAHYGSMSRPTIETLSIIVTSIPMLIAARWVLDHKIERDVFVTVMVCLAAMLEPLRKLSDVNSRVQQSNVAATRVFEVIDMPSEPNHSHSLPKLPRHKESVEFRDIVFSYPGHEEIVLNHVSCKVLHGQTVAVVGGNGSGKSTLLNLLPRLYWPTSGQVLIDGTDISTVSLRSLRKQIGLVTQDTLLFADSIYNNIAYGTRHATREQVIDAAKRAFADEFISGFPDGYQTRVGEHGVRLSGGQKQRIAIARAILHDPSILILDEAMSQIDSDSEKKISLALREFTKNRTVLMIAHRFQTVISADQIIVLDHGRVAGIGTHGQLIETCGAYRKLYENQFREMDALNGEAEESAESPVTELT